MIIRATKGTVEEHPIFVEQAFSSSVEPALILQRDATFRRMKSGKSNHKDTKAPRREEQKEIYPQMTQIYTERLEPQPNGDCRHLRHARAGVSHVQSYYARDPDVALSTQTPGVTKPKFRSLFPKRSSRFGKKMRISSAEKEMPGNESGLFSKSLCFFVSPCLCGEILLSSR